MTVLAAEEIPWCLRAIVRALSWPDNPRHLTAGVPGAPCAEGWMKRPLKEQLAEPWAAEGGQLNLLIRNNCLGELDRWGQQGLRFGKIRPAPTSP